MYITERNSLLGCDMHQTQVTSDVVNEPLEINTGK